MGRRASCTAAQRQLGFLWENIFCLGWVLGSRQIDCSCCSLLVDPCPTASQTAAADSSSMAWALVVWKMVGKLNIICTCLPGKARFERIVGVTLHHLRLFMPLLCSLFSDNWEWMWDNCRTSKIFSQSLTHIHTFFHSPALPLTNFVFTTLDHCLFSHLMCVCSWRHDAVVWVKTQQCNCKWPFCLVGWIWEHVR